FSFFVACPKDGPYYSEFEKYARCAPIPARKFSLQSLYALYRFIGVHGIDIIHSHGKGAGAYSRPLGLLTGRPVVHTFHGFHYSHLSALGRLFYIAAERALGRLTDVFINVSQSEKALCEGAGLKCKGKAYVIPNGVDVPLPVDRRARKGIFTIITVTRLAPEKAVDILLDAIKELKRIKDGFRVIVAGDGPEKERLVKKAADIGISGCVEFVGFRNDVPKLLEEADLFLTCSRGEGMPISLLEAMARGLPVVASNVPGNSDVVENAQSGFLFALNSPAECAARIKELMEDNTLYRRMSEAAYKTALADYSVDRMCESTMAMYQMTVGAKAKKAVVKAAGAVQ
ncbi:MAG: glycosyltransferase, partial [Deltaproteobacteria bacterium]